METNENVVSTESLVNGFVERSFFTFREHSLNRAAGYFVDNFKGRILFAVKTNPESFILKRLFNRGVRSFDVASLEEIRHARESVPEADLFFMHPVKPRRAIRQAYFDYGIRSFSLDSIEELEKIVAETESAKDLNLFVRIAIPNTYAELNLAEKFGINLQAASDLIKKTAKHSDSVGVCFHVGSQCMHPDAYRMAIQMTYTAVKKSGVKIKFFNVGGGFPSIYPGMVPPPMADYFEVIHREIDIIREKLGDVELVAEPGRALVAESMSLIVRVDLRKNNVLYINDGTYGSLFDAGIPKFIFPAKLVSEFENNNSGLTPFSFYGPTCDSLDFMKGPFYLPDSIREGDYIEIGQMGAYGRTLATNFNGFAPHDEVFFVSDEPLMTMYAENNFVDDGVRVVMFKRRGAKVAAY